MGAGVIDDLREVGRVLQQLFALSKSGLVDALIAPEIGSNLMLNLGSLSLGGSGLSLPFAIKGFLPSHIGVGAFYIVRTFINNDKEALAIL